MSQSVPDLLVPNLPGFTRPTKKTAFGRKQTWNYVSGVPMEFKHGLRADQPKLVKTLKPADPWRQGSLPSATSREVFQAPAPVNYSELPAWDVYDRHVLRFYGYFKEAVPECNLENYRVRRAIIYYYLEDDTMHITEPKIDNAGIPQGTLIRRHRCPAVGRDDDDYMKPADFIVGEDIVIYGKNIRLIDCDEFTRAYYLALENPVQQRDAQPVPTDVFTESQDEKQHHEPALKRNYEKLYRENMLGGGHINNDMQQFMENDRKVCRFFGTLDDLLTAQYECRPFTILYFLADDTVEIREQYPLNCGRDNFPRLFRRGKIKRGKIEVIGPTHPVPNAQEWVRIEDFSVGTRIPLLNQDFFLYDADTFTRNYFKNTLGMELAEKVNVRLPEREVPRPPTPEYVGYGSWDDSMASVINLIPKVPRKDFHKLMYNEGKVLRFTAKFTAAGAEDVDRRFVVSFFLFDDNFSIHEPPQRNLGIITGRFLEKAVHLNQKTGRLFSPKDLLPGTVIQVFNHEFTMLEMDEFTRKWFDSEGKNAPYDLNAVLEKVRESMRLSSPNVRDIFRKFDRDHNGVITVEEVKEALQKFSFSPSDDEVLCIMRYFDKRQDGQISYNEFCDAILDPDYETARESGQYPHVVDPNYKARVHAKTLQRSEVEKIRRAAQEVTSAFYMKIGLDKKLMKEFSAMTHQKTVSIEMVHAAMLRLGLSFDLEDVERAVMFLMPGVDCAAIPYMKLLQSFNCVYHDLCAVR